MAMARRPSFHAMYSLNLRDADVFVGREAEVAFIEDALKKISNGRSGVIVIDAPPGRGKTTLVMRAKKMGRGKIKVASGVALSNEIYTPYYSFRQILEAYTGIRPAMTISECRQTLEKMEAVSKGERINVAALAQILPWMIDGKPSEQNLKTAASRQVDLEQEMCDNILRIIRLMRKITSEISTLIVIEDLQWMDMMGLRLLSLIFDNMSKINRLAILITYRTETNSTEEKIFSAMTESLQKSSVSDSQSGMKKANKVQYSNEHRREMVELIKSKLKKTKFNSVWLDLQPFSQKDTFIAATKLLGCSPNESSAEKLWKSSKGDPFHLQLLTQWLKDKGAVREEKSGACSIPLEQSSFPPNVQALIQARIATLQDPIDKIVLEYAASGGDIFDLTYISNVSRIISANESKISELIKPDMITSSLLRCEGIGILIHFAESSRDQSLHKWKFKHDLYYRTMWIGVDASKRARLDKLLGSERYMLNMRLKNSFFETFE